MKTKTILPCFERAPKGSQCPGVFWGVVVCCIVRTNTWLILRLDKVPVRSFTVRSFRLGTSLMVGT